ncbi:hypothetical protein NQ317_007587 [Molorchus minor]|uniref:Arrestin-like N-terminal domain-containing protein n=1 Tax=Molorchus minor TaxID=1323400 RepID=A0ABQ9JA08_9CUCU|nr:hypothetical protein NQ317_007587 [Molorchus minor]
MASYLSNLETGSLSKMSQCKVWLDNYNGQYYPGAQVQGRVILNFDSETKLRGVKVSIVCHEHTEWMDTENYYDTEQHEHRSRNTLFKGDNDAFITEFILYGNPPRRYPRASIFTLFSINLPNILPGTFNCEHGSISYKLIACVDRPMAFDYQDEIIFVVVAPIDLNLLQNPRLLEPTSYSEEKPSVVGVVPEDLYLWTFSCLRELWFLERQ